MGATERDSRGRQVKTEVPPPVAERFAELCAADGQTVAAGLRRLVFREVRAADRRQEREASAR